MYSTKNLSFELSLWHNPRICVKVQSKKTITINTTMYSTKNLSFQLFLWHNPRICVKVQSKKTTTSLQASSRRGTHSEAFNPPVADVT